MKQVSIYPTIKTSQVGLNCRRIPSINVLETAYDKGVRLFDIADYYLEGMAVLRDFININKPTDITISTRVKSTSNIVESANKFIDFMGREIDILTVSEIPSSNLLQTSLELGALRVNNLITSGGIRSHEIDQIRMAIMFNFDVIQMPINPIDHGAFMAFSTLEKPTIVGIKVFGKGAFIDALSTDFLLKSTLALLGERPLIIGIETQEQLLQNLAAIESFDIGEYPLVNYDCNSCQRCNAVCMNKYPLAKLVKYSRQAKHEKTKEWASSRLSTEAIQFECINCRECEKICPLQLPVRQYILDQLVP